MKKIAASVNKPQKKQVIDSDIKAAYEQEAKERAEASVDRLYKLQYLTSALSQAVTYTDIAHIVVTVGVAALSASEGSVWMLSPDGLQHIAISSYHKEITHQSSMSCPQVVEDAIRCKKPVSVRSLEEMKKLYPGDSIAFKKGIGACIALPLVIKNTVLGAVLFGFDTDKNFSVEEQEFMFALVQQCAQSMDRARLYEEEKKSREKVEKTASQLQALQETATELSKANTLQEVLRAILNKGIEALGASGGEIAVLNDTKTHFHILAYKGYPASYSKNFSKEWQKISLSQPTLMGEVVAKQEPIFVTDVSEISQKYRIMNRFITMTKTKSLAIVPLKVKNETFGTFFLIFNTQNPFLEEDKKFILALSQQSSQAIERSRDYDERARLAADVQNREARFRSLIEHGSDVIMLLDEKGKIIFTSNSSRRITSYSPEDRKNKKFLELVIPEDREKTEQFLKELQKLPIHNTLKLLYRIRRKDGRELWMEGIGTNQLANQHLHALILNSRDITRRIEATQELKRSKDELEIILEHVADGVTVYDKNGNVVYANPATLSNNRVSADVFYSKSYYEFAKFAFESITDREGNEVSAQAMPTGSVLKKGQFRQSILRMVFKKDHAEQWRSIKSSSIMDGSGKLQYVVSIHTDITEDIQKERLKDEFISTASHELKTPVTSAKLYTELLQKQLLLSQDSDAYRITAKIDEQLTRITKLITDLLDATKIRSGALVLQKQKVPLMEFLSEIAEEMQLTTITHTIRIMGTTRASVFIDKDRMRQVLENLISNAIKYSPDGKKVDIVVKEEVESVVLCVRDYGIGISPANRDKIFEPFYRAPLAKGQRFPGLGLGLHIASEIIRRHEGKIWLESKIGKGSTFCILLKKV